MGLRGRVPPARARCLPSRAARGDGAVHRLRQRARRLRPMLRRQACFVRSRPRTSQERGGEVACSSSQGVDIREAAGRQKHALVVEDDADGRGALLELLTLWDYRVTEAADPKQALALTSTQQPDVVVIDLVQGADTLHLIERIK